MFIFFNFFNFRFLQCEKLCEFFQVDMFFQFINCCKYNLNKIVFDVEFQSFGFILKKDIKFFKVK